MLAAAQFTPPGVIVLVATLIGLAVSLAIIFFTGDRTSW